MLDTIPGVENIEGNLKTKELTVSVVKDDLAGEITAALDQIGYPVGD